MRRPGGLLVLLEGRRGVHDASGGEDVGGSAIEVAIHVVDTDTLEVVPRAHVEPHGVVGEVVVVVADVDDVVVRQHEEVGSDAHLRQRHELEGPRRLLLVVLHAVDRHRVTVANQLVLDIVAAVPKRGLHAVTPRDVAAKLDLVEQLPIGTDGEVAVDVTAVDAGGVVRDGTAFGCHEELTAAEVLVVLHDHSFPPCGV